MAEVGSVTAAGSVRVRFFAAAQAAAGVAEVEVPVDGTTTIRHVLEAVPPAADQNLVEVLARCSFLLNTVSTTDAAAPVTAGDLVDVLPPFAGG